MFRKDEFRIELKRKMKWSRREFKFSGTGYSQERL